MKTIEAQIPEPVLIVSTLERALGEQELKVPDPADATLERRYRKIP